AHRALIHAHVRDPESADEIAQMGDVRAGDGRGYFGRHLNRARHDFDQRDTGTIEIQQRMAGPVNTTGRPADVQGFAGVFFHVGPLDFDTVAASLAVRALGVHVDPAVET